MSRVAVDTKVLVHLYDLRDPGKRQRADELLPLRPVISARVLSEFLNVLKRVTRLPKAQVLADTIQLFGPCEIAPVTHGTLAFSARLLARYDFPLFDAIIVAAALEADCDVLYSAAFQHNQLIEGRLRMVNPFR